VTSHQRLFNPNAVDLVLLMEQITAKYDDRPNDNLGSGCCTDDDIAVWIGQPRNIAAKVRIRLERKNLIERVRVDGGTYLKLQNPRAQWVMCYRPVR